MTSLLPAAQPSLAPFQSALSPLSPSILPSPLLESLTPLTPTTLPLPIPLTPNLVHKPLSSLPTYATPLTPVLIPTLTPQAPPYSTWHPSASPISFSQCPISPPCLPHAPLSPLTLAHTPLSPPAYPHTPLSPLSLSHPPLSPSSLSYSPYPTSPMHRTKYRAKAFDMFSTPEAHIQRRRAPSPLISCSERPAPGPPRPASLPVFPSSSLYGFDFHSPLTPPLSNHTLPEHFFPATPPLMHPPSSPTPPSNTLASHFLSGGSSPSCLSYPLPASPHRPFASKPLPYWSKYDVADWLSYLNLPEHRDRFLDNEIDGSHLPSLTKEDYLDLGVSRVGHRMNIERALRRLTERSGSH